MSTINDFMNDPHGVPPWKFPGEGIQYLGVIMTNPYVAPRLDDNRQPERTAEGNQRWELWVSVETQAGARGLCINNNELAKAFNGRANEQNLRRWAATWKIGGRLTILWTRADSGSRKYRGRYDAPAAQDDPR